MITPTQKLVNSPNYKNISKDEQECFLIINKYNNSYKNKLDKVVGPKKLVRTNSGRIKIGKRVYTVKEFKDAENSDFWYLRVDKDKLQNKILEAKKITEQLKEDYGHYFDKTSNRESQIRKHIDNLDYVHAENIEKTKNEVASLIEDVNNNILMIEQKKINDVEEKKKDIENRINIRLMDSEYNHRVFLEKKIKEQESFMRTLHSFTTEIQKIQLNYKESKNQNISLTVNIELIEENIKKNKNITDKLLKEMANLKSVIFSIKNEIYLVYKLKNEENMLKDRQEVFQQKLDKIKTRRLYSATNINDNKDKLTISENNVGFITNRTNKTINTLTKNKLSVNFKLEGNKKTKYPLIKNSFNEINFENPLNKLEKKSQIFSNNQNLILKNFNANDLIQSLRNKDVYVNLITKYPKIEQSVKHLCNIMFGLQTKNLRLINSLKFSAECENELKNTIFEVTKTIKTQNYQENKEKALDLKELYVDKNNRKKFISMICKNPTILNIFNDDKFPTISISNRKMMFNN